MIKRIFAQLLSTILILFTVCLGALPSTASSAPVTDAMQYWVDPTGAARVQDVAALDLSSFAPMAGTKPQRLTRESALWLRYVLPELNTAERWLLKLEGPPFTNLLSLYQQDANGNWQEQLAGDHTPRAKWSRQDVSPVFNVQAKTGQVVWLRVQEFPSPSRPTLSLITESQHQSQQTRSLVLVGAYFGFCVLVLYLGVVYWRLYQDNVFAGYVLYVACMMGLQACFTGLGHALLWPQAGPANDIIIAVFAVWVVATGLWFVRKMASFARYSRWIDRAVQVWCLFGFVYPLVYALNIGPTTLAVLNLYGMLSVVFSFALCLWAWRRGEIYGLLTLLAFLPLHIAYIFPGLRLAGVIADGASTQYAFLIGSAIEIPALLYLLHRRAVEYTENAARMQALRSNDALTGLPYLPVMELRHGDAMRRMQRKEQQGALVLVELSNHAELTDRYGHQTGEHALVATAAHLRAFARDIDTVCRVGDAHFALLLEPPVTAEAVNTLAQSIVAKGLSVADDQHQKPGLQYTICTLMLPDVTAKLPQVNSMNLQQVLDFMRQSLDASPQERGRRIVRLPAGESSTKGANRAALVEAMKQVEAEISDRI